MSIPADILNTLPTPCLVIDLLAADRNIGRAARICMDGTARLRPHFKAHKCTELLRRQVTAGGCAGVTCQTSWEAVVLARSGFPDILVANQVVDPHSVAELADAAAIATVTVAVDSLAHVDLLAATCGARGVQLNIVIELDVGMGRCGLPVGSDDLLPLAEAITRSPRLSFAGLQAYEGHAVLVRDRTVRRTLAWQAAQQMAYERDRLLGAGIPCTVIGGGGTGTLDMAAETGILNQVQAGSYVLMDARYAAIDTPFEPALYCAATLISRRSERTGVLNAGLKQLSAEKGPPTPTATDVTVVDLSDEHAQVAIDPDAPYEIGDRLLLTPSHLDPTVNLHGQLHVWDGNDATSWWVDGRQNQPNTRSRAQRRRLR